MKPLVVLVSAATVAVFALTIGSWKRTKSMILIAVLMALAFVMGGLVAEQPSDATVIYAGLSSAFLVYFCFILGQLVATLKEIVFQLQVRK